MARRVVKHEYSDEYGYNKYGDDDDMSPATRASIRMMGNILNRQKNRKGDAMNTTHKTKDGTTISIASMDSEHLFNTISYFVAKLEKADELINREKKKTIDNAIYGSAFDADDAEDYIEDFRTIIAPYLIEAVIRGVNLSTISARLQKLFDRSDKRTEVQDIFMIEGGE